MPIDIPALLLPISAEAPSGEDLRYHPLTEKIKEARRQEEDIAQGVWKREVKTAEYPLVLKLSTEALTKHSKDLQIAAWLTEALANLEGLNGLRQGLDLVRGLLENFWDSVYPQIEDGDLDLRATPLSWIGAQLGNPVRSAAILKGGHNWYSFRSSKTVPSEEEAQRDPEKLAQRTEALEEGEVSPEDFEKSFDSTPFASLKATYEEYAALQEHVSSLNEFCNEKFGDDAPDLGPLRSTLEEVGAVVRVLFKKKEGLEPDQPEEQSAATEDIEPERDFEAAAAPTPRRRLNTVEPSTSEEALDRVFAAARYLRREQPQNPVPYLLVRSIRWGELRAAQASPEMLAAPPTNLRLELKRLAAEGDWDALRHAAEEAFSDPSSRAWLDLQRYAVQACRYSACYEPANAIISTLRALIADFPQLPSSALADDTPSANAETTQWLVDENITPSPAPEPAAAPALQEWTPPPPPMKQEAASIDDSDPYLMALDAAQSGRIDEAVEILSIQASREKSGRARFLRRAQLAQVCMSSGYDSIGRPLLQDLSDEIGSRALEHWETPDMISQPLALLYRSLNGERAEEKEQLYARICKLDPLCALRLAR